MSHFSIRSLSSLAAFVLAGATCLAQTDYIQVYFTEREVLVQETGSTSVVVELSRRSASQEIVVPFSIAGSSTATPASSTTEGNGDYFIASHSSNGVVWDPDTGSGSMTFAPGTRRLELPVSIMPDDTPDEGDETIHFQIDTSNVTIARPVEPSAATIIIQDDDPVGIFFERTAYSIGEGQTFSVMLALSNPPAGEVTLKYTLTPISATANAADLELDFEGWTGELKIPAGAREDAIEIPTGQDLDIEDEIEQFTLNLDSAVVAGVAEGTSSPLRFDERTVTLSILDNDPTNAVINASAWTEEERQVQEFSGVSINVMLDARVGREVTIPLLFGGTATRGDISENNNADYEIVFPGNRDDDSVVIPAGGLSARVDILINNDTREDGDQTLNISLGTPIVEDGGTINIGENAHASFTIIDNDPVTLYFGKRNAHYDSDDDSTGEPYFPSSGYVVGETDGVAAIPIVLSSPHGRNTLFDIELLSEGTTASLRTQADDEDWDFHAQSVNLQFDTPVRTGIQGGQLLTTFNLVLNGDRSSDAVEGDETVRLRLSKVDSDSGVTLGDHVDFTLTIREFPDIDVTDRFAEQDQDFRVSEAVLNPNTGLHEIEFSFTPQNMPAAEELAGYRAYKVAFRPSRFDASNPDSEGNDPTLPSRPPDEIEQGFSYNRIVNPTFEPRYPTGIDEQTLVEGEPLDGSGRFTDANADIRRRDYYFLQRLNLEALDPQTSQPRTDFAELHDPFRFLIEFSNEGVQEFDYTRLTQEGGLRVYLTRDDVPAVGQVTTLSESSIMRFLPRDDGTIFVEVNNPARAAITVEYLDEEGVWRRTQPSVLRDLGTRLYWIDHGPPRTHEHPSEVEFRLYRFSTVN